MSRDAIGMLHASDLHLGRSFADIGSPHGELKQAVKDISTKGQPTMRAHDGFILAGLETGIREAARYLQLAEDKFDVHVLTGDISTTADSIERFDFARSFLTSAVPIAGGESVGARLPKDSLICVPGNHDKMNESSPDRYLSSFSDLPASLPYAQRVRARTGQTLCFYGLDSNIYEEGIVARGVFNEANLAWLLKQANEASTDEPGTLHILLLHHHPCDLNRFRRLSSKRLFGFRNRLTRMDEGGRLLEACSGWIDIIMHGHEHFPIAFREAESGCVVVSAGTLSQRQSSKHHVNCFHGIVIDATNIEVIQFNWGKARFTPSVNERWQFELAPERTTKRGARR